MDLGLLEAGDLTNFYVGWRHLEKGLVVSRCYTASSSNCQMINILKDELLKLGI